MSRTTGATTTTPADVRADLLARLGLDAGADDRAVEVVHDHIVEFLDEAPEDLRGWADRREREADRLLALLTGPESELPQVVRRPSAPAVPEAPPARSNRFLLGVIAVLVAVGVVVGVWWAGRPSVPDVTGSQPAATQSAGVDKAKLADLQKKVTANPKDVASLQGITDLYFAANDWTNAKAAAQKVLAVDPKNEQGLISLGAASYNGGDQAGAEKAWKDGTAAYPKNAELHYDLGFLYMTTGRTELMKAEWAKVVEIDPNSALAKTVQSQVGAVSKPSATK